MKDPGSELLEEGLDVDTFESKSDGFAKYLWVELMQYAGQVG